MLKAMQAMDIRMITGQQRKASMKPNQYQTKEGGTSKVLIPERASLVGDEPRRPKSQKEIEQ
jgi:hypothetical protein